jgi:hypothetical protein
MFIKRKTRLCFKVIACSGYYQSGCVTRIGEESEEEEEED